MPTTQSTCASSAAAIGAVKHALWTMSLTEAPRHRASARSLRANHLHATGSVVEGQTMQLATGKSGRRDDIAAVRRSRCRGHVCAAMPAEMDHGGLELAYFAQQIERLRRPPGHEIEPIAIAATPELCVDRARLAVQREARGSAGIRRKEQDHVLLRCHPWLTSVHLSDRTRSVRRGHRPLRPPGCGLDAAPASAAIPLGQAGSSCSASRERVDVT
jgi:hypothetical protein